MDKINKLNKPFKIASVCRADLIGQGYSEEDVMKLTNSDMGIIASKISDGVMDEFWRALDIVLENRFPFTKRSQK